MEKQISEETQQRLLILRKHHMRECERSRELQNKQEAIARSFVRNKFKADEANARAKAFDDICSFHLKAVQALNEICDGSVHDQQ